MNKKERRKNNPPVPEREKLAKLLAPGQVVALNRLENYGWQLKYVRRPLFQDVVPILFNAAENRYCQLDSEGNLHSMEASEIRKDDV